MSIQQVMLGLGGYKVNSADFDGINDFMSRGADLTNAADAKTGTLSIWLRIDAGDGALKIALGQNAAGAARFSLSKAGTNKFEIVAYNAAGTLIMDFFSNSAYAAGATWRHVLASWDLAAGTKHLYVNDVNDLGTVSTFTNDTIDYTQGNFFVGNLSSGGFRWDGCMAEVYLKMGVFTDFSQTINRRKFISGDIRPVFLGADGSRPGLGIPELYLHLDKGEAVADFATNRGSGGNFTITGALDTGSSSPSD